MTNKPRANAALHRAQTAKNDDFYTQLSDIEKELEHYRDQFRGKVVFCNCDDPLWSNFFLYFAREFSYLGLKKLITTHYEASRQSYRMEISGDENGDGRIFDVNQALMLIDEIKKEGCSMLDPDIKARLREIDIIITPLPTSDMFGGNSGDFRSAECIKALEEADIVCTNPPFSLFREYVAQLVEYDKKFLILGNDNCRTYKEIFKLIKDNRFWCGYNHVKKFNKPDGSIQQMGNVSWYTNLEVDKRNEEIIPYMSYEEGRAKGLYPKYDNYDAIEVSRVELIPKDYWGVMGVPITFLDRYDPRRGTERNGTERNGTERNGTERNGTERNGTSCNQQRYDNIPKLHSSSSDKRESIFRSTREDHISMADGYMREFSFDIVGNGGCYAPDGYSLVGGLYVNGQKMFKRLLIKRV